MRLAIILVALLLGSTVVYMLAAGAQRQGWVNFKAAGSGMTAGIAEVGRALDPPARHVQTVREEMPHRRDDGDPDGLTPPPPRG